MLTFNWPGWQHGFQKQDVQQCLKGNKGHQKCQVNYVGRNVWAIEKYILTAVFDPSSQGSQQSRYVRPFRALAWGLSAPVWESPTSKEARRSKIQDVSQRDVNPSSPLSLSLTIYLSISYSHFSTTFVNKKCLYFYKQVLLLLHSVYIAPAQWLGL